MDFAQQAYLYGEENLVKMASNGELDAFNQLVLLYQDLAYHHAYALLRDPTLAEDATQDGFIRGFQNIAGFRGGSFRAWILKIMTNSAYDMLRRSRHHQAQSLFPKDESAKEIESPALLSNPNTSVDIAEEQTVFAKELYALLDELPEVYRTVLTLMDIYELDYAEAAFVLSVPIGIVKSRLYGARLQISQKL